MDVKKKKQSNPVILKDYFAITLPSMILLG